MESTTKYWGIMRPLNYDEMKWYADARITRRKGLVNPNTGQMLSVFPTIYMIEIEGSQMVGYVSVQLQHAEGVDVLQLSVMIHPDFHYMGWVDFSYFTFFAPHPIPFFLILFFNLPQFITDLPLVRFGSWSKP